MKRILRVHLSLGLLCIILAAPSTLLSQLRKPTTQEKQDIQQMINRARNLNKQYKEASKAVVEQGVREGTMSPKLNETRRNLYNKSKALGDSIIHKVDSVYNIPPPPPNTSVSFDPDSRNYGQTSGKESIKVVLCPPVLGDGPGLVASTKIHEFEHARQRSLCLSTQPGWYDPSSFWYHWKEWKAYSASERAYDSCITSDMPDSHKTRINRRIKYHGRAMMDALVAEFNETQMNTVGGTTVHVPILLYNPNNFEDKVTVTITQQYGWPIVPDHMEVTLHPDQQLIIPVEISVPPWSGARTVNQILLQAVSTLDTSRKATDVGFVTIISTVDAIPPEETSGFRGQIVEMPFMLTNKNMIPDVIHAEVSNPLGWMTMQMYTDTLLMPGEKAILPVLVIIPPEAEPYATNLIACEARSMDNPLQTDKALGEIEVKESDVGPLMTLEPLGILETGEETIPRSIVYNYGHVESFFDVFVEIELPAHLSAFNKSGGYPGVAYRDSVMGLPLQSQQTITLPFRPFTPLDTGFYTVRVFTRSAGDLFWSNDTIIDIFEVVPLIMNVSEGWNMLSLPLLVDDPSTTTLFPYAISSAFKYSGSYVQEDSMEHGPGYWLKFASPEEIVMRGEPVMLDTVPVDLGWNMIGSIDDYTPVSTIVTDPPGIVISSYFGYNGGYIPVDSIAPGAAYWVKTNQPGKIILHHELPPANRLTVKEQLETMSRIIFGTSPNLTQSLYFGLKESGVENRLFELPPAPPAGAPDIRFASNRILELVGSDASSEIPIAVNSELFPVGVRWDVKLGDVTAWLRIGAKEIPLGASGAASIPSPETKVILKIVGSPGIPKQFALEQNYPNPFNPVTTIRYQLPAPSMVALKIFNILGQEVATLFNELQEAGYKSTEWNANNLSSGVYFYRLEAKSVNGPADGFIQVKKMMVIK